jgi:hypothetical protein
MYLGLKPRRTKHVPEKEDLQASADVLLTSHARKFSGSVLRE